MAATAQTAVTQQININFRHLQHQMLYCKSKQDQLRISRLVLDSTKDEISDLIKPTFSKASKLDYGASVYVKVRKQNEVQYSPDNPNNIGPTPVRIT
ncbi:hypothetical protein TNCV_3821321 [Trichonephila clavipes]|nr:hypothetical protein TNCV_3821321 [Trichonephila clavipes]